MAIRKPIFVIPVDLGTVVSGNVRAGYAVSHLSRQKAIGLTWRTEGASNAWARGAFNSEAEVDFCSLMLANAQPGTTIRLRLGTSQAEVDGSSAPYDSGALPFISPSITRDDGLYHSHLELSAVEEATWWRIDIGGHTGDFQAANLVLGKKIEPANFYNFEWDSGIQDLGSLEITRLGVFDEEPGLILRTISFTLGWVGEAEFEASFRPMMETLGLRGAIYCCFDPEANTMRQAKTYLGVFQKPPFARSQRKPQTYSQEFQILSLV
jgi:hypothetical protein